MSKIVVEFAVYGALKKGQAFAYDVTKVLQFQIDHSAESVRIDNATLCGGKDPCPGETKHFGAKITRDGVPYEFACQERQTIDFTGNTP